jgi:hypothetical protein
MGREGRGREGKKKKKGKKERESKGTITEVNKEDNNDEYTCFMVYFYGIFYDTITI